MPSAPTITRVSSPSRALRIAAVPLMLAAGALVAAQSEINGRLAAGIGEGPRAGFLAAVISFGSGLLLVTFFTVIQRNHRDNVRKLVRIVRDRRVRPVELIGGAFGALLVASQGLTVGTIGVALFAVAVTAGQATNSLVVDHYGIGPSGHQPLSIPRAVAASFAVLAVILAAGERLTSDLGPEVLLLAAIPLLAGAGTSVQQALNGRIAQHVGPWVTTFNNFVVGTACLVVALALSFLGDGRIDGLPGSWWLYVGGAIGVGFIWLAALLVHVHGVLILALSMIAGQVIGAQAIELTSEDAHVGPVGIAAGALTVLGVLLALALRPRPSRAGRDQPSAALPD